MLKPIVLVFIYNKDGEEIGFETAPFDGNAKVMTNLLNEVLKKYEGAYVMPVTGFEPV